MNRDITMVDLQQALNPQQKDGAPERKDLDELLTRAQAEPIVKLNISWRDKVSKENFKLTLELLSPTQAPSWYLDSQPSWTVTNSLWAVSSFDLAFVCDTIRKKTDGASQLQQALQIRHEAQAKHIQTSGHSIVPNISLGTANRVDLPQPARLNSAFTSVSASIANSTFAAAPAPAFASTSTTSSPTASTGLASSEMALSTKLGIDIPLDQLLLGTNLINMAQIADAISRSEQTGLPVGRILTEMGALEERVLKAALMAQSLIRDGMLHMELAVNALTLVASTALGLEAALKKLGWRTSYYHFYHTLGRLLLDAGCVTREELVTALEVCFASGLQLGRVLTLRKVISRVVAYAAVSAQILMREGKMTRVEALAYIKLADSTDFSIQTWQEQGGTGSCDREKLRLGQLLVRTGLVSELDLLSAVERSLLEEKQIGQILLGLGLISEEILQTALQLQSRLNAGELPAAEAIQLLKNAAAQGGECLVPGTAASEKETEMSRLLQLMGLPGADDPKALLHEVLIQKENLAYKVVSQHEEIRHRLARELHDSTIADLLALRRYLSGDRQLTPEEIIEMLDSVVKQLREICNDFAPRELHDWGLKVAIENLAERFRHRTNVAITIDCNVDLGQLPEPVELHTFRIIQEWLNNIEKHAEASQVLIRVTSTDELIRFEVFDNGKGFDSANTERDAKTSQNALISGGGGTHSIHERVDLIRAFCQAKVTLESIPEQGSQAILELIRGKSI